MTDTVKAALSFFISNGILEWKNNGGCRAATDPELEMWVKLSEGVDVEPEGYSQYELENAIKTMWQFKETEKNWCGVMWIVTKAAEQFQKILAQGLLGKTVPDGQKWSVKINKGETQSLVTKTTIYRQAAACAFGMLSDGNMPALIEIWCEHLLPDYGPYFYIVDEDEYGNFIAYTGTKPAIEEWERIAAAPKPTDAQGEG